jgi:hypothetical protein
MQEITRIKDLVQHTWENTLTGQLYRASLELFLIEVGIGPNVLDIPPQVMFLATDSLICSTVFFLQRFNICLHHDITMVPQRQHDVLIMRQLSSLNLSQEDLFACNMCRIYLGALYLSDITSGDGLEISEAALIGIRDVTFRADSWPFCPKPSPHKWIIWRKCLGSSSVLTDVDFEPR